MQPAEYPLRRHAVPVVSPFGAPAALIQTLSTSRIVEMYRRKCGVDVRTAFRGRASVSLYQCTRTGYRFWRPADIACDERLYKRLSNAWAGYYKTERWEYDFARSMLKGSDRVLEIGCGRGYFLRSIEGRVADVLGLELNREAIFQKVTQFPIRAVSLERLSESALGSFEVVCAFQVLEHLTAPGDFLEAARDCLSPGGLLVLSTPNHRYRPHRRQLDAFDLPPHHMGHFDEAVFSRIARLFGLHTVEILTQPPRPVFSSFVFTGRTGRIPRVLVRAAYRIGHRLWRQPGPNLLAVLRKGTGSTSEPE